VRLLRRSLLARIVAYFLVLGSLVVLALGVVSYFFITGSARASVAGQLEALATVKDQALRRWVDENRRRVLLLTQLPGVRRTAAAAVRGDAAAASDLRVLLRLTTAQWPELSELLLLSEPGGLVVCSTIAANEGQYRVLDTYFVQGRRAPFVQNVHPSPITLKPTMTIAAPLAGPDEERVGVLAANLDLDVMEGIVRDRTGLGANGEAYLVDANSVFVSGRRFGSDEFPRGVHSPGIDAALRGVDGAGQYLSYRNVQVIGVYRWLAERRLALLVEVPAAEAYRHARRQTALLLATGLGLVLVLVVGVYVLGRRIARPILAVQRAAQAVADGRLEATVPVATEDEIGVLAGSFNRMTARLRDLYAELRSKEEYFRSLIETSTDMIVVLDAEGRFRYVSPSSERLIGYSPAELLGTVAFDLVHPDDADWLKGRVYAAVIANRTIDDRPVVFRLRHKNGTWRTIDSHGRNMIAHPAIRGVLINARDVTERRQLEERLRQAQKMEAVGRLAGGIAHDFNNLLTAILGYSDLVAGREQLDDETRSEVREIRKAAERAAALTRQLLAFSRKQVLQPKVLDLNRLVTDTEALMRRLIGENIDLRTSLAPDLPPIRADRSQIEQVVVNLVVNARDAMPDGGTLTIETRNAVFGRGDLEHEPELGPGSYVVLAVSDTGHGMSAEVQANIFDPFFTTKPPGQGTGLGLPTVLGIVKQSGGRIVFTSRVGAGTRFEVHLPAASPEAAEPSASAGSSRMGAGHETILVVEDEESVRRLIGDVLSRAGYRVRNASEPLEALRQAVEMEQIDLLVTDVVLPGMNGRQLAEELTARRSCRLKVLFISGHTEDTIVRHKISSDTEQFLQKPFDPAALVQKVRVLLDGP